MAATTEIGNKQDPLLVSIFDVELDNGVKGYFTEATGLGVEVSVQKSTQTMKDGRLLSLNRPGVADYQDITLKRTFSADKSFWKWIKDIADGKIRENRTGGAIVMYNSEFTRVGSWSFLEAWPSKWSVSDLDAGSDDLMIETVTLTIEMLKRDL